MDALHLTREAVLRYAGWNGQPLSAEFKLLLEEAVSLTLQYAEPRVVYRKFAVTHRENVVLAGTLHLPGMDAAALLCDCSEACLLAVTIGLPIERLIRRHFLSSAELAVLLDAAGSAAVEAAADRLETTIRTTEQKPLTVRFSPGYGDLPVTVQPKLLELLDAPRRIGVSCTESGLLTPAKSITAIMGIGRKNAIDPSGCAHCRLRPHCSYHARGQSCYHPKTTDF